MAKRRQERAQSPQRIADLNTLKAFWDIMSQHFGNMPIDLSLFNYKASTDGKPLVRQAVREKVPMTEAYQTVLELLDEYHKGEDILWRPSKAFYSGADWTSMLWVDDFKLDNDLGLVPFLCVQTSENKLQAFFKLRSPVLVEKADELQKALAKAVGDTGAGSFFQHRRMAGLANGKYKDDPICILYAPDEESQEGYIDPTVLMEKLSSLTKPPSGGGGVAGNTAVDKMTGSTAVDKNTDKKREHRELYIKPVVPANYMPVSIKERDEFVRLRDDGTIDESATDMAWATHIVRRTYNAGWDEVAIAFTVYDLLLRHSPEVEKRKGTPKHLRDYLFRTVWKAIKKVKETPSETKTKETVPELSEEPLDF
jgi:hypothetical protein